MQTIAKSTCVRRRDAKETTRQNEAREKTRRNDAKETTQQDEARETNPERSVVRKKTHEGDA